MTRRTLPPAIAADVVVGVAAPQQLGDRRGKPRHILQPVGQQLAAVEVAADPDVVDAGHVAQVVDVVGDLPDRGRGAGCSASHAWRVATISATGVVGVLG